MIDLLLDPVLRGPTWGVMLMCFSAGLMGAFVVVRRRSLLGESLSHAAYPGVTIAIVLASFLQQQEWMSLWILVGAFFFTFLAYFCIDFMQTRLKVSPDSALCFVLAIFFGAGSLAASVIQFTHASETQKIHAYLFGQAATMTDFHIFLYGGFALFVLFLLFLFYKELSMISFDRSYSRALGAPTVIMEVISFALLGFVIVVGIRTVGVVLMSAMLIAPAVAARQFTHRLSSMLLLSGFFGLLSGLLGSFFSYELSKELSHTGWKASFPTGPMIVLTASFLAFLALLFAPQKGLVIKTIRLAGFRWVRTEEDLLKAMWRCSLGPGKIFSQDEMTAFKAKTRLPFFFLLLRLKAKGFLERSREIALTEYGYRRGGRIIRLHRLWELYLVDSLGMGVERVHKSAEEMEHILTEEIEMKLTELLENPKEDPHHQPIPAHDDLLSRRKG